MKAKNKFFRTVCLAILVHFVQPAIAQRSKIDIAGTVRDAGSSSPLSLVSIRWQGSEAATDGDGRYAITVSPGDTVTFSRMGYSSEMLIVPISISGPRDIFLRPHVNRIEDVVVHSGYQELNQKDLAGSVSFISKGELERNPGMNLLDRMRDMVPGLVFNKNTTLKQQGRSISIRGQSTMFANSEPLIVLDNFPYEGDIKQISPEDVESITVLKDAAAAAIWGARAGNGVIVITTKKGSREGRPVFDFGINFGWAGRPDLKYIPKMSSRDYIGVERMLYEKGFYRSAESSINHAPISPAVELLIAHRDGKISSQELQGGIADLEKGDIYADLSRLMYRPSWNQRYHGSFRTGTAVSSTMVSLGYDRQAGELVENGLQRLTLSLNQSFSLWKGRFQLEPYLSYSSTETSSPNRVATDLKFGNAPIYPYASLIDPDGSPSVIGRDYRREFTDRAEGDGLLDWGYRPLLEQGNIESLQKDRQLRLGFQANFKIDRHLSMGLNYRYVGRSMGGSTHYGPQSYMARNLVNNYSSIAGGKVERAIPLGGIMDRTAEDGNGHNGRLQLQYDRQWDSGSLKAIAGAEISDSHSLWTQYRLYGYDAQHESSLPVDYISAYRLYSNPNSSQRIPYQNSARDLTDRFLSYYSSLNYLYSDRYILGGSLRWDRSNIFGVESNQKGVPLFSVSAGWNLHRERFMLPLAESFQMLKIRASYGLTGNLDNSLSAHTTSRLNPSISSSSGLRYAYIVNPANPELRWERVHVANVGLDLGLLKNRVVLNLDLYRKVGTDLIGNAPFPASSGITRFYGNTGSTQTSGIDLLLDGSYEIGPVDLRSVLLLSHLRDKVTSYRVEPTVLNLLSGGYAGNYPVVGRPLTAMYALPWAGLDPLDGRPLGQLDGEKTRDYAAIVQTSSMEDLIYLGSSRPAFSGSLRQEFGYGNLSLSIGIAYRLGYWFRRSSVNYNTVLSGMGGHGDFAARWQRPGDESTTQVPSMPQAINFNEVTFYQYARVLMEPGDHVRLQDIRLQYALTAQSMFRRAAFFLYVDNVGMVWKKTGSDLDPDYPLSRPLRSFSIGIKLDL